MTLLCSINFFCADLTLKGHYENFQIHDFKSKFSRLQKVYFSSIVLKVIETGKEQVYSYTLIDLVTAVVFLE